MMGPPDGENGPSRKWRWFKKSEKEVKSKTREHSCEQEEQEELKGNAFVEELFEDPLEEESTSENVQARDTTEHEDTLSGRASSKDTRTLCESLVIELLFKIMDSRKNFDGEDESSQSKPSYLFENMKDKLLRQDADDPTEGLLVGNLGCQGCGTEQVLSKFLKSNCIWICLNLNRTCQNC